MGRFIKCSLGKECPYGKECINCLYNTTEAKMQLKDELRDSPQWAPLEPWDEEYKKRLDEIKDSSTNPVKPEGFLAPEEEENLIALINEKCELIAALKSVRFEGMGQEPITRHIRKLRHLQGKLLSSRLKRLMYERGIYKVSDLAKATGVNDTALYPYVEGRSLPGEENMSLLTAALGVDESYFTGVEKGKESRLPQRLKAARVEKGMSLKDVAKLTGRSPAVIAKYESGECKLSAESLKLIADILDVSPEYLLGIENQEEDEQ